MSKDEQLNKKQKLCGENGAQDECDFLSGRYFLHAIFPAFKVFKTLKKKLYGPFLWMGFKFPDIPDFKKYPRNAEIRY